MIRKESVAKRNLFGFHLHFFFAVWVRYAKKKAMKKLIVYGASFLDVIKLVDAINRVTPTWQVLGYLDDNAEVHGRVLMGYSVLGGRECIGQYAKQDDTFFFVNISSHWTRAKAVADALDDHGCKMATLVHPAVDMNYVRIGRGCIIPEGCVVGGNVSIGDFVIVRLKSLISHDVTVEDFVFVGAGVNISSNTVLRQGCYIGTGATIMRKKVIGESAIVGAGAVVTKDVPPGVTVTGVPAIIMDSGKTSI